MVLFAGSPLMGDDGVGLAALAALRDLLPTDDPALELVDGGTWGMNLMPLIEAADRLLIVDAVRRAGARAGDVLILERDELPLFFATKLSPHQIDLREVLTLAELRGTLPSDTAVVGVEPARVELGIGLSDEVGAALPALVDAVLTRLERWGHDLGLAATDATAAGADAPPPGASVVAALGFRPGP